MANKGYFPLFMDISDKKIVVIGAGAIASRRVAVLSEFCDHITVVAPKIDSKIEELEKEKKVTVVRREYQREDIYDAWMVLAATDDDKLNDGIYSVAKCLGALVNIASNKEKCDFHFPGIVKKDSYVIGVNASGKDHHGARRLREEIAGLMEEKNKMERICIGSRESKLAVIQSEMVMDYLKKECPDKEISLLTMKTTGDKILDRTLDKIGGKGLFVKELDKALLDKRSDLSVHSLKDMPMETPEELPIVSFSKREDPRDVLVLPKGKETRDTSKPIGCSSLRRILQLKELYPDAEYKSVRGNVITRLKKLDEGEYGALVLAAAGLKRLGLEDRITSYFEPEQMIPAAGQGILAIQGRAGEDYSFLNHFSDKEGTTAAICERAFVRYLDGGCSSPVAAHAIVEGEKIHLMGLY
ncbi:MAG: hydroxymethylbilane synthase, partial [Clostridia bacterium]|nr:hydroxymethylbilane synthase [Clostridia bacterium]